MANGYYGAGAKLAHYCYEIGKGYVCPKCGEIFKTESPMEWHYLRTHNPPKDEAREIVRWNRFHKYYNTEFYQKTEEEKKEKRAIVKAMKRLGYSRPSKFFKSALDWAFIKDGQGVTWQDAKNIIKTESNGQ